jgi:hypothetical protein
MLLASIVLLCCYLILDTFSPDEVYKLLSPILKPINSYRLRKYRRKRNERLLKENSFVYLFQINGGEFNNCDIGKQDYIADRDLRELQNLLMHFERRMRDEQI